MTDYIWIRAWGLMWDHPKAYVEKQLKMARKANAPQDAVMHTSGWVRVDELEDRYREQIKLIAKQYNLHPTVGGDITACYNEEKKRGKDGNKNVGTSDS